MAESTTPVPEELPIVVSANSDRMSGVVRTLLGAVVALALAGAVALPARDLLLGTTVPRPRGEYTAAAVPGGLAALVAGFLCWLTRPVSWTIDAGGITQDGPGDRRRDLRWADVRRVLRGTHGYEFYGRAGLTTVRLSREAIPKDRRASVLAGVEAVLREHFDFPPPPTGGLWRVLAWAYAVIALVYGPPCLYLYVFLRPLVHSRRQTITGWAWVRGLIDWNVDAASALVPSILFAPALAYLGIAAWLVCRKVIRDTQIVPRRPGSPRAA
jgi:hypothetical protein